MKKLFSALLVSLVSVSAFAAHPSLAKYKHLLNPENLEKLNNGKIAKIVLVESEPKLTDKKFASKLGGAGLGTSSQALVDGRTCYAAVYVEKINYSTTEACDGSVTTYMNNANIAVELDYKTFPSDLTSVEINLYAQHKGGLSDAYLLVNDVFDVVSDAYGSGANTVVYVVGANYAYNYDIFADVYLDDERGTACVVETNATTIQ